MSPVLMVGRLTAKTDNACLKGKTMERKWNLTARMEKMGTRESRRKMGTMESTERMESLEEQLEKCERMGPRRSMLFQGGYNHIVPCL